jgi:tetratricopeptide (TPR) repeat protein
MPGSTLGQRLKQARKSLGLTQEKLGGPELSKGFISLLEHDRARPSVQTLELLAQRLGCSMAQLLDASDHPVAQRVLDVMNSRGRSELVRRRYDQALGTFRGMQQLAVTNAVPAMELNAILGLGEALLGLRQLDEARSYLTTALERGRAADNKLVECRALHGLATVEHRKSRFPKAVGFYRAALAVIPALGGSEAVLHGEILLFMGTVLGRMGRIDEALDAYSQSREIFDDAARPERAGEALNGLGNMLTNSGDYDGALIHYERARALFEQYEDLQMTSYVRNNLGILLVQIGRAREALPHFITSLAIKQRMHDSVGECHTLTELARCYMALDEQARAHEYAELALERSREAGVLDEVARAQIVLGVIAFARGDRGAARDYLTRAAAHCQHAVMMPELVTIFRELARLASAEGLHEDAAAYHEKAFEALRDVGPNDVVAAVHLAGLAGRPSGEAFVPEPRGSQHSS